MPVPKSLCQAVLGKLTSEHQNYALALNLIVMTAAGVLV